MTYLSIILGYTSTWMNSNNSNAFFLSVQNFLPLTKAIRINNKGLSLFPSMATKPFRLFIVWKIFGFSTRICLIILKLTSRVFSCHIFSARGLSLLYPQIGYIKRRHVHIIWTVLMSQRTMPFGTWKWKIIQFQFIPLIAIDLIQHLLEDFYKYCELF